MTYGELRKMKEIVLPCIISSVTSEDLHDSCVKVEMMNYEKNLVCLNRQSFLRVIDEKLQDRSLCRNYHAIADATLHTIDITSLADDDPNTSELNDLQSLRFCDIKMFPIPLLMNYYLKTNWFLWWLQDYWIKISSVPWWFYFFWISNEQITICTQH